MKLLLCVHRSHSASQLFINIDLVIRNLIFKFITRHDKSDNAITQGLMKIESDLMFTFTIWRHWYKLPYVTCMLFSLILTCTYYGPLYVIMPRQIYNTELNS